MTDAFPTALHGSVGDDLLRALFDTVIPADDWPGGWDGGVRRLLHDHLGDFMSWSAAPVLALSPAERSALLSALSSRAGMAEGFDTLLTVAYQGFYAGTQEPAGWSMVGYSAVPAGVTPVESVDPEGTALDALDAHYDVIVVGAGAGGGAIAQPCRSRAPMSSSSSAHALRVLPGDGDSHAYGLTKGRSVWAAEVTTRVTRVVASPERTCSTRRSI